MKPFIQDITSKIFWLITNEKIGFFVRFWIGEGEGEGWGCLFSDVGLAWTFGLGLAY
jgi:hypothetical protein